MKNGFLLTIYSPDRILIQVISLIWLIIATSLTNTAMASEVRGNFKPSMGIQVDTIFTHDSNVSRGYGTPLSDNSLEFNMRKSHIFPFSSHTRAVVTGVLDGNFFKEYSGLTNISGGIKGSMEYRGSSEFMAPTYSFFANAFLDQYHSDLRDGHHYSVGLSFRSPLSDRIRFYATLASNKHKGSSPIFDDGDNSFSLNLDYDITRTGTIYFGGERRHGDIVSTINYNFIPGTSMDDAFPGLSCIKLGGTTDIYTLGYNWGLGTNDSIDFSMRKITSTLDSSSSNIIWFYAGWWYSNYETKQYSIAYLRRF